MFLLEVIKAMIIYVLKYNGVLVCKSTDMWIIRDIKTSLCQDLYNSNNFTVETELAVVGQAMREYYR